MKRLALALLALTACADPPSSPPPLGGLLLSEQSTDRRVYLVEFTPEVEPIGLATALVRAHGGTLRRVYSHAIRGFSAELPDAAAAALERHPLVLDILPDGMAHTTAVASWGLDRIDQRDLPLDATYTAPNTGAGVRAYIIDSGIRFTHADFGGRAVLGADFIGDGLNGADCLGHGTHVAGTVGGTQYGVAKGVTLVSVRVFGCVGSSPWETILAAIDWVTANAVKPAVANMSLGGGGNSIVDNAVAASIASGVTYSVASGNSNFDACSFTPARVPEAITVNASTIADARASFSNFGTCTDIFAPGVSITSAYYTADNATATLNGTSMAAPHVGGAAAMILSANPSWAPQQVRDAMVAAASPGKISNPGTGSPNALLFADWIGAGEPPPPPPPPVNEALFTTSCADKQQRVCTFSGNNGSWTFSDGAPPQTGATITRTFAASSQTTVTHVVGEFTSSVIVRCNKKNCR